MMIQDMINAREAEETKPPVDSLVMPVGPDLETPSSEERKIEIFQRKLAALINELSLENLCDTPDFILAEHLTDCLYQHARIINKRENWYGRPSK